MIFRSIVIELTPPRAIPPHVPCDGSPISKISGCASFNSFKNLYLASALSLMTKAKKMTEIQAEMVVAALPIWTILKVRSKAIVNFGEWYRRLVESRSSIV